MTSRFPISLVLIAALFAGCAANIVDVQPPSGGGASLYGWRTDKPVTYTTEQSGGTVKTSIGLRFLSTSQDNTYKIVETYPSLTDDTLQLRSSSDSLIVSGLTERSVIKVPSGYALNRDRFDTIKSFRTITKVYAFGDAAKQVVACDDSCHIFFSTDSGTIWTQSPDNIPPVGVGDTITGFIYGPFNSSKSTLCAATTSGHFYTCIDGVGAKWSSAYTQPLQGRISNLCATKDAIYGSVAGLGIYKFSSSSSRYASFPTNVTDLSALAAMNRNDNFGPRVSFLAGSARNGIFTYDDSAKGVLWQQPYPLSDLWDASVRFIYATVDSAFVISAQANSGSGLWVWKPTQDSARVYHDRSFTMGALDESARYRLIMQTASNEMFLAQSTTYSPNVSLPTLSHVTSLAIGGIKAFAATQDSGIYSINVSGGSNPRWVASHSSPATTSVVRIPIPLEFNLLVPPSTGLAVGETWPAGTIIVDSLHLSATVRADVVRYIDSLKLTNGLTFSKIFVVNYAFEDASHSVADTPVRWTIYYAQSEGPVLIDEVQEPSGILLSRAYRSSK